MPRNNPKKRSVKKAAGGRKPRQAPPAKDLREEGLFLSLLDKKEKELLCTEEALIETMRLFRDLFEQSPIGVGIHDPKGDLLVVNKAWLDILGLESFDAMKDHNLFTSFHFNEKQKKLLRSGKVMQCDMEYDFGKAGLKTRHEGPVHLLYIVSPLFRDKDIIGYMTQVQNATERKKMAEAQRLAQLGRLLADMAHEVNNPLMIISGMAELALVDGVGDERLKDTLNTIVDQCFFAKDIIQRLLKYSRIGKVEKKPVDVPAAINLVVGILSHHMRLADITIKKRMSDGLPSIVGNEKQLQELFMNILHNSADAMMDGGTITIDVERDSDFIRIEITDTGEGMSRKVMERIFEPFFTTKQKGTGLGLAVCHTIVQEHGGQLFYDSKIGEGTRATVLLPVSGEAQCGAGEAL